MAKRGKSRRSHNPRHPRSTTGRPLAVSSEAGRRNALHRIRNATLAIAVLAGGGWYVSTEVTAGIREADLSRIGNGIPTVVQIHDPGCPTCRRLQRQTRTALAEFAEDQIQYVVANIRKADGKRLAQQHGVGHVTLLLFDGHGQRQATITGLQHPESLRRRFAQLVRD